MNSLKQIFKVIITTILHVGSFRHKKQLEYESPKLMSCTQRHELHNHNAHTQIHTRTARTVSGSFRLKKRSKYEAQTRADWKARLADWGFARGLPSKQRPEQTTMRLINWTTNVYMIKWLIMTDWRNAHVFIAPVSHSAIVFIAPVSLIQSPCHMEERLIGEMNIDRVTELLIFFLNEERHDKYTWHSGVIYFKHWTQWRNNCQKRSESPLPAHPTRWAAWTEELLPWESWTWSNKQI